MAVPTVSLRELADLAIGTPEVGAVNFTALHTLIVAMLKNLNLLDTRIPFVSPPEQSRSQESLQASFSAQQLRKQPSGTSAPSASVAALRERRRSIFKPTPPALDSQMKDLTGQVQFLNKQLRTIDSQVQGIISHVQLMSQAEGLGADTREWLMEKLASISLQEIPLQERQLQQRPLQERPLQQRPLQEGPLQERPSQERLLQERPLQERPLQERPLQERPLQEMSSQEMLSQEMTWQETQWQERPSQQRPAQQRPSHHKPSQQKLSHPRPSQEKAQTGLTKSMKDAALAQIRPVMAEITPEMTMELLRDVIEDVKVLKETQQNMSSEMTPKELLQKVDDLEKLIREREYFLKQVGRRLSLVPGEEVTMVTWEELEQAIADGWRTSQMSSDTTGLSKRRGRTTSMTSGDLIPSGLSTKQPSIDQSLDYTGGLGPDQTVSGSVGTGLYAEAAASRERGRLSSAAGREQYPRARDEAGMSRHRQPSVSQVRGDSDRLKSRDKFPLTLPRRDERDTRPGPVQQDITSTRDRYQYARLDQHGGVPISQGQVYLRPDHPGLGPTGMDQPGLVYPAHGVVPLNMTQLGAIPPAMDDQGFVPLVTDQRGVVPPLVPGRDQHELELPGRGQPVIVPLSTYQQGMIAPGTDQRGMEQPRMYVGGVQPPGLDQHGFVRLGTDQHGLVPPGMDQQGLVLPGIDQRGLVPPLTDQHGLAAPNLMQVSVGQQGFVQPRLETTGFIRPGTEQRDFIQPGRDQYGLVEPGAYQPGLVQHGMGPHGLVQPGTDQRGLVQPGAGQPGLVIPGAVQPGWVPTGAGQPGLGPPGAVQPGLGPPGAGQPGLGPPGAAQPSLVPPGAGQPGLVPPGAGQPGLVTPGAGQPGLVPPGAAQPGLVPPGAGQPGLVPPGAAQPGFVPPGVGQPGLVPPGAAQPGLGPPSVGQPGLVPPGAAQPGLVTPGAAQPGLVTPGAAQPGLLPPGAGQPGLVPPGAGQPGLVPPGAAQPGLVPPGAGQPGLVPPGAGQPGLVPPGAGQPGLVTPGAAQPGLVTPGAGQPGLVPPRAAQPGLVPPGATQLGLVPLGTGQPGLVPHGAGRPGLVIPGAGQPGLVPLGAGRPGLLPLGAVQPGLVPPGAGQPGLVPPGAGQPGLVPPGAAQPGLGPPGAGQPGLLPPGEGQPDLVPPGAVQPGLGPPGAAQPGLLPPGAVQPGLVPPGAGQLGLLSPGAVQHGLGPPGAAHLGLLSPGVIQHGLGPPGAAQLGLLSPGVIQPGFVPPSAVQPGLLLPGAVQPGLVQPGAYQPSLGQPGTDQHSLAQPGAYQYEVVQPGMDQSGLAQPGADQHGLVQPGVDQHGLAQPGVDQRGLIQPGAYQRGLVQPGMGQPGLVQPGADQHDLVQPGMDQSGLVQPGMDQSGLVQPGMDQSGLVQPGMGQWGLVQPSAYQRGLVQPGMGQRGLVQPGAHPPGLVQPGAHPSGLVQPGASQYGLVQPGVDSRGLVQPEMDQHGLRQPGADQQGLIAPGTELRGFPTLHADSQSSQAPPGREQHDQVSPLLASEGLAPPDTDQRGLVPPETYQQDLLHPGMDQIGFTPLSIDLGFVLPDQQHLVSPGPDQPDQVDKGADQHGQVRLEPMDASRQLGAPARTAPGQDVTFYRRPDSLNKVSSEGSEGHSERRESIDKLAPSFPIAMETFRLMGELIALYVELKEHMKDLKEEQAGQTDLEKIQYLLALMVKKSLPPDLQEQLKTLKTLTREIRQEKAKLDRLQKVVEGEGEQELGKELKSSQLSLQLGVLRVTVADIEKELSELRESQERGKAAMENSVSEASLYLQEQLDKLRTIMENMMASSSTLLSMSMTTPHKTLTTVAPGQIHPEATCPACSLDVSHQVSMLVQRYEHLQDMVNNLAASRPSRKAKLQSQDEELLGHVQSAILQVQGDCEKLNITTGNLIEDHRQKQKDIDVLYQGLEKLEKEKANRENLEMEIDVKADKSALASKVSRIQFDATTEQLNHMMQELVAKMSGQEQDWQKMLDKLLAEMDNKLDRLELDPLKQTLEDRWKSLRQQLKERSPLYQADEAAAMRRQLLAHFHCLSCDRPLETPLTGQIMPLTPVGPGLPGHRSMRPYTVFELEQVRQQSRNLKLGSSFPRGDLTQMERSVGRLRTMHSKMLMDIEKVQIHFGGSVKASSQMIRELLQAQCLSSPCYKRVSDTADYTYSTVPRRCGGSHTLTYPYRRSRLQHLSQGLCPTDEIQIAMKHDEVDILGLDGHIYKGRMDTRLPGILTKDTAGMSKPKSKQSRSHRQQSLIDSSQLPSRPQSAQMLAANNPVSTRHRKDRPVSSEAHLSQTLVHPPSPMVMVELRGSPQGLQMHMDVPPGEGMEEPTRGPRSTTAHRSDL
nr:glutamine-rich protein 2 isoform X11 [Microcebus murinus]